MDIRRRMIMGSFGSGEEPIYINNYLTIEALEDGLTASLSTNVCEYCIDGDGNWITLAAGTTTQSINTGQTLSFRGELTPTSSNGIGTFTINKECNLLGNCMSMLFGDNATNNYSLSDKTYAFYDLFYNCPTIVNVSSGFLPATTLADHCYNSMFRNCTSLVNAPELPATTLADYCYNSMFYGCTSLVNAPELPATTLAKLCYNSMFLNCTSLTTAPELPATTLMVSCYGFMFINCSSLNYIKMLATDISASYCLNDWVFNVAPLGTFVKNSAMTTLPTGVNGIPEGWSVLSDDQVNEGAELITFEILSVAYTAEKGMTWAEWCDSNYNIADSAGGVYRVSMNKITRNGQTYVALNGTIVNSTETIVSGAHYALISDGDMGGGSD